MNPRISYGPPWPAIYDRVEVLFLELLPFDDELRLDDERPLEPVVRLDVERPFELPDDERLLALGDDCLRPLEDERFDDDLLPPPDDELFFVALDPREELLRLRPLDEEPRLLRPEDLELRPFEDELRPRLVADLLPPDDDSLLWPSASLFWPSASLFWPSASSDSSSASLSSSSMRT
jgi:hypothetical protein